MNFGVTRELRSLNRYPQNGTGLVRKYQIMLVEDEVIVALDIRQRLEALGYNVVAHASSGEEAVIFATELEIDLILMDIKLRGEMDGIDAATKIRDHLDIPIIYLTAFADEKTLSRARLTEAYGYLIKPFEDRELRSSIVMALYKYQIEQKLKESEERYALATRAANDGIWDWDLVTDEIYYSPRWISMLGLDEKAIINTPGEWLERIHSDDRNMVDQALNAHLSGLTDTFECEYRILHQDGGYRWMLCRGLAVNSNKQKPYRIAGSQSDITNRKRMEQELIHKALHDELTELPNRALFEDRLHYCLAQMKRNPEKRASVLFLDLDNFKFVNDNYGHGCGDELLIRIARILEKCLRPGDTVSRFGGDEFAILVDNMDSLSDPHQIADRIQRELSSPIQIENRDLLISASIGIIQVNSSYQTTEDILRDVDIAMYSAKNKGKARFEEFDTGMRETTLHRINIDFELRNALLRQEFILHYQPIFEAKEKRLVGFEALIRWQHPTRGLVYPNDFIHIAEETKQIIPIGDWVLKTACLQAQEWNRFSSKPLKIAVNLSRIQLRDELIVQKVVSALEDSNLPPGLLELEITESTAMDNIDITYKQLEKLQEVGVTVAIDDFGCGYSSLDHLKKFPANTLKIDRSFINDLKDDDQAIVLAMVQMAHQLRLKVIGEGVETNTQLTILADMDCDEVQGYLLGKGVAPEEIWGILNKTTVQEA
jgi:diguanylate cyclase (GGDEF)-like protein/PAS domain S-box-containing protein